MNWDLRIERACFVSAWYRPTISHDNKKNGKGTTRVEEFQWCNVSKRVLRELLPSLFFLLCSLPSQCTLSYSSHCAPHSAKTQNDSGSWGFAPFSDSSEGRGMRFHVHAEWQQPRQPTPNPSSVMTTVSVITTFFYTWGVTRTSKWGPTTAALVVVVVNVERDSAPDVVVVINGIDSFSSFV